MKRYDFILIGSGAGNIVLDAALEKNLKCAIIEKDKFGGTCLNRGCIPTKVLLTPTDILHHVNDYKKLGIFKGSLSVDWDKLASRMWSRIANSEEIRQEYLDDPNTTVYEGKASFVSDKVLRVEYKNGTFSEEITADKILVAVGGRTFIPQIEGLSEINYLTSETFFGSNFPKKPYKSLAILGSGAIGTEFASLFNALGTEVHLIVRGNVVLSKHDESLQQSLKEKMLEQGINIHFSTKIEKVTKIDESNISLTLSTDNQKSELVCEQLLIASGIQSNLDLMKIENTNLKLDAKNYLLTNEFMETNINGIYAIGDVAGRQQLRHKANYEAEILANNLFQASSLDKWRRANYEYVPGAIFTSPQIASVGYTEKELKLKNIEYEVGIFYYSDTAKGYALGIDDDKNQFVKVITSTETNKILGVHAIGPEAAILIQPYINLMNTGKIKAPIYYPEIASEEAKHIRENYEYTYLNPQEINAVSENMVIHPALSEVAIWAAGTNYAE